MRYPDLLLAISLIQFQKSENLVFTLSSGGLLMCVKSLDRYFTISHILASNVKTNRSKTQRPWQETEPHLTCEQQIHKIQHTTSIT